jgi:hypothetical protein
MNSTTAALKQCHDTLRELLAKTNALALDYRDLTWCDLYVLEAYFSQVDKVIALAKAELDANENSPVAKQQGRT